MADDKKAPATGPPSQKHRPKTEKKPPVDPKQSVKIKSFMEGDEGGKNTGGK